jgi:hypothetical protein
MTSWRSVAAAVDDTTAVLDSCSLKHRRRAYTHRPTVRQGGERGSAQNEKAHVCKQPAMNGGEVCNEGEKGLEDLELDVDALGQAIIHRLDNGGDG